MTARRLHLVNGWADSLAIGGLSILTAISLLTLADATGDAALMPLVFPVALLVNYPHFSTNLREFPVTAIGLPLLLLGAVAAGLWQPELIAPYLLGIRRKSRETGENQKA